MIARIIRTLAITVVFGALIGLGTEHASARGGHFGGGGGGARVGAVGGAHGFSGARMGGPSGARMGGAGFSGARVGSFRGAHIGSSRLGAARMSGGHIRNFNSAHFRSFNGARIRTAHVSNLRGARALGATGALAGKAAWNHWGNPNWNGHWQGWNGGWSNWHGGWGGWVGPVFWPYFFGNVFAFTFWPYPYFDPFWTYGDWFVWDALFWPGPYYIYDPAYAYGPGYYDVYGRYAYAGSRRARVARHVSPEITGSTSDKTALAQSCAGLAPGVTDFPIERIEKAIQPNEEQRKALDGLKAASLQASDILKASCSDEVPLTPLGRLDAVQKRIEGLTLAFASVRTPLDNLYNSLNEEQRQRFSAFGQASNAKASRRARFSNIDLAGLCSRRAEGFTQLPVQRVEEVIKPTQQQLDAFARLKIASVEAANQLHASCPGQTPQTPLDRFDAVGKRLEAMDQAIKTIRPALVDFYASLTDEQKARFNTLGPSRNSSSRQS